MQEHNNYFPYIFSAALAAVAQALMYVNSMEKSKPFSWVEFGSAVALSGFIGLLIALAGDAYGLSTSLTGALAGLGGFAGKEGVSVGFALFKRTTGIQ